MIKNTRKDEFKKYFLEKRHSDEELSNAVEKILNQDHYRVQYAYEHCQTKEIHNKEDKSLTFNLNLEEKSLNRAHSSMNKSSTKSDL